MIGLRSACLGVAFAGLTVAAAMLLIDQSTSALLRTTTDLGKPPPPPAPAPPPPVKSDIMMTTVAEERDAWRIEMIAPADCRVNASCDVIFRLVPALGWSANRYYPYKFQAPLAAEATAFSFATNYADRGVATFSRASGHVDLVADGTALVHVVIVPRAAGRHRVTGRLRASACTTEICRIGSHDIDVSLTAI